MVRCDMCDEWYHCLRVTFPKRTDQDAQGLVWTQGKIRENAIKQLTNYQKHSKVLYFMQGSMMVIRDT